MNKNKKIIITCLTILVALIVLVLMIRNPDVKQTPEPTAPASHSEPTKPPPKEMDTSHEKVIEIVDDISKEIGNQAPAILQRLADFWNWFEQFPTMYAVILLVVALVIIAAFANGNKHRGKGR